jgi:DNA-binding GntR family transcriptional regulator
MSKEPSSLHGKVVAELRRAIVNQRYRPGERLVEDRLALEMGVSRNPVREAIRALASEGLIDVAANRGATVARMTEQAARETIEARALLEGHNARLAARRQDKQTIKRIESVLKSGTRALAAGHLHRLADLNQQFHEELAAAGRNTVLGDILKNLRERTAALFPSGDAARQTRTWREHAAILRAIIDGDERAAASLAAEHVMHAGSSFVLELDGDNDKVPLVRKRTTGKRAA